MTRGKHNYYLPRDPHEPALGIVTKNGKHEAASQQQMGAGHGPVKLGTERGEEERIQPSKRVSYINICIYIYINVYIYIL